MQSNDQNLRERVRVVQEELLSDNWAILKKTTLDYQRSDGSWQTLIRETYDRGNGAAILLYNRATQTVLLTRQFRYPAFVNGHPEPLIEACAGLLDQRDPAEAIRRETEEELGYRIREPRKVMEVFMSPGSVTEKLFFFVAEYDRKAQISAGGGLVDDGEDIDVLEVTLDEALRMIERGEIIDGKTIILLQYAQLHRLVDK
ncbi:MAG TPA: NUDIX domain-containing protein [Phototrophicaceae bacterium]|nr:NUDIX domain-containing protein [Phototrophicaceae bacterium]